jgi:hypothetical protein
VNLIHYCSAKFFLTLNLSRGYAVDRSLVNSTNSGTRTRKTMMRDMKRQAPFSKYTGLQLGKVLSYLEHDDGTIALVNVSSQRTAYVAIIKEAV